VRKYSASVRKIQDLLSRTNDADSRRGQLALAGLRVRRPAPHSRGTCLAERTLAGRQSLNLGAAIAAHTVNAA